MGRAGKDIKGGRKVAKGRCGLVLTLWSAWAGVGMD